MSSHQSIPSNQDGVALIVSLIILLILSLSIAAAANTALLEKTMAANAVNRQIAFQAAESALEQAQTSIRNGDFVKFDGTQGLYPVADTSAESRWKTVDWAHDARSVNVALAQARDRPQFIVEELPPVARPGAGLGVSGYGAAPPVQFYRITTRATGATDDALVMVESTYHP